TPVLAATVWCSRGSRVRLNDGLSHTKEIPTSPERPTHSFHALCAAPPGARVTKWKYPTLAVWITGPPSDRLDIPRREIVKPLRWCGEARRCVRCRACGGVGSRAGCLPVGCPGRVGLGGGGRQRRGAGRTRRGRPG